jgi:AcrR family transcriptional regulator
MVMTLNERRLVSDPYAAEWDDDSLAVWRSPKIQHLLDSVMEIMFVKGFHSTSTRDIADAAGWNMSSLYRVLREKQDLLYYLSKSIHDQISQELRALPPPSKSALNDLQLATERLYRTHYKLGRHVRFLYRESASLRPNHLEDIKVDEMRRVRLFEDILQRGVRSGEFRPVDTWVVAQRLVFGAAMWPLKTWSLRTHATFESYLATEIDFITAAILARSGDSFPE